MICIIALIVFAFLAIFSARYRPLAKEAFDCVFRRVTLRKCNSNLDKRLKAKITGGIMKRHKALGRFVYKYFEVFSWFFLIIMLLSLVQIGISVYNYAAYGNCNGPDSSGFCIFDPLGEHSASSEVSVCSAGSAHPGALSAPGAFTLGEFPRTGRASAPVTIVEFGCFACPNTAKQAPAVQKLIEHFGQQIQFVYVDFPISEHQYATEAAIAARCVREQSDLAYWQYHFTIFENQDQLSPANLRVWAGEVGVDLDQYDLCIAGQEASSIVADATSLSERVGVYGTPTFFIGNESLVGVQPYKLLRAKVSEALKANS